MSSGEASEMLIVWKLLLTLFSLLLKAGIINDIFNPTLVEGYLEAETPQFVQEDVQRFGDTRGTPSHGG